MTGLPVLRARDLAALGVAVGRLWRPHPAMRGGRSIVDEAGCVLVHTYGSVPPPALEPEPEERKDLVADSPSTPPLTVADGDWLRVLRRCESRFSNVHPDIDIGNGGRRVTLRSGEQQQWRTAMLGMNVMRRGRHYAEFTLIRSMRQGSMTVGVVDCRFRPEATEDGSAATKTPSGWGYWAHSVSYALSPSPLPLHVLFRAMSAAVPKPNPATTGVLQGAIKNNSAFHDWDGKTAAREGDVIGLLLDLECANGGSLTVFKNGTARGTAVTVS